MRQPRATSPTASSAPATRRTGGRRRSCFIGHSSTSRSGRPGPASRSTTPRSASRKGRNGGCWTVGVAVTGNVFGLSLADTQALRQATSLRRRAAAASAAGGAGAHYVIDGVADILPVAQAIEERAGPRRATVNDGRGRRQSVARAAGPWAARPSRPGDPRAAGRGRALVPAPVALDALPERRRARRRQLAHRPARPPHPRFPRQQRPPGRLRPPQGRGGDQGPARPPAVLPAPLHQSCGDRSGAPPGRAGAGHAGQGAARAERHGGDRHGARSSPATPPAGTRRSRCGMRSTAPTSTPSRSAARRCSARTSGLCSRAPSMSRRRGWRGASSATTAAPTSGWPTTSTMCSRCRATSRR